MNMVFARDKVDWAKPCVRALPVTEELILELMKTPENRAIIAKKFVEQLNEKRKRQAE